MDYVSFHATFHGNYSRKVSFVNRWGLKMVILASLIHRHGKIYAAATDSPHKPEILHSSYTLATAAAEGCNLHLFYPHRLT